MNSPLDVTTREMIGKVFFILSVTTDPSQSIRLTSSLIALVMAALHKVGKHGYDLDLQRCRLNWKAAKAKYVSGMAGWSYSEDILSDVHDFLYDVALENDIIIIKSEWYNLSRGPMMSENPDINPLDILQKIQEP